MDHTPRIGLGRDLPRTAFGCLLRQMAEKLRSDRRQFFTVGKDLDPDRRSRIVKSRRQKIAVVVKKDSNIARLSRRTDFFDAVVKQPRVPGCDRRDGFSTDVDGDPGRFGAVFQLGKSVCHGLPFSLTCQHKIAKNAQKSSKRRKKT